MMFAETVLSIRKRLRLSQQAFAKELGVSYATINRWENNNQKPSALALRLFEEYCRKNHIDFPDRLREKDGHKE